MGYLQQEMPTCLYRKHKGTHRAYLYAIQVYRDVSFYSYAVSVTARRQPPPKAATEALKAALEKHAEQNGPPSGSEESAGGDSGSEMSQALTELSLAGSQTRSFADKA